MKYLLVVLFLSCSAFADVTPTGPRPNEPAWRCEAAGINYWGRWVGVWGDRTYRRYDAEGSAWWYCRQKRLARCHIARCHWGWNNFVEEQTELD